MKVTTHLDHISKFKTASDANWSSRWTYRVFITSTRRDWVLTALPVGGSFYADDLDGRAFPNFLKDFYLKAKARIWP